jgi:adenylate cyclase
MDIARFIQELRRRRVARVAAVYAAFLVGALELTEAVVETYQLSEGTVGMVVTLGLVGFPLALIFAWVFDLTRQGLVRTPELARDDPPAVPPPPAQENLEGGVSAFLGTAPAQLGLLVISMGILVVATTMALRSGPGSAPPSAAAAIRHLAVLPLSGSGDDPTETPFLEGMHDALIAELAGLDGLSVISRTSVLRYRDRPVSLSRVATELDVDAVVEGAVQRSADSVVVTVRLTRADPVQELWAGRYDGSLAEALSLQRRVARAIASEISLALAPESPGMVTTSIIDPSAQEFYFQGRANWRTRSRDSLARAIQYLEEAIRIAPDFALAHAALADAHMVARGYGATTLSWEEAYERAESEARRALALDPRLAEAHASLGFIRLQAHGDLAQAERSLREAIRLNPSLAQAHAWLALTLKAGGRAGEAVEAARVARRLDPFSPVTILNLGFALVGVERCDEALEQARTVLELDPRYPDAHALSWRCHALAGDRSTAVADMERVFTAWGLPEEVLEGHRRAWNDRGWEGVLRHEIQVFEAGLPTVRGEYFAAQRYSLLGDTDGAFRALEAAREARDPLLLFELRSDPLLAPLRSDARFDALAGSIGRGG